MTFNRLTSGFCAALFLTGALVTGAIVQTGYARDVATGFTSGFESIVSQDGTINLPKADFRRDWTMLGAWVVNDEKQASGLHNVYAQSGVVDHFRKTGEFPDGTILVKELLEAATSDYTTGHISFANQTSGWFVMVKDRESRFRDHPLWGNGWGWAYFEASDPQKLLTKSYREECLTCHVPAEKTDWIYTEAYPVLGDKARDNDRFRTLLAELTSSATAGNDGHGSENVAAVAEEVKAGEKYFKRCVACHTVEEGKHKSGPSLADVYGRKAGTVAGYNFSEAMRDSGIFWNDETLDKHLTDVPNFIPGNRMGKVFSGGVKKAEQRKAIIEYLKTR